MKLSASPRSSMPTAGSGLPRMKSLCKGVRRIPALQGCLLIPCCRNRDVSVDGNAYFKHFYPKTDIFEKISNPSIWIDVESQNPSGQRCQLRQQAVGSEAKKCQGKRSAGAEPGGCWEGDRPFQGAAPIRSGGFWAAVPRLASGKAAEVSLRHPQSLPSS